jgi:hypothetical protein
VNLYINLLVSFLPSSLLLFQLVLLPSFQQFLSSLPRCLKLTLFCVCVEISTQNYHYSKYSRFKRMACAPTNAMMQMSAMYFIFGEFMLCIGSICKFRFCVYTELSLCTSDPSLVCLDGLSMITSCTRLYTHTHTHRNGHCIIALPSPISYAKGVVDTTV